MHISNLKKLFGQPALGYRAKKERKDTELKGKYDSKNGEQGVTPFEGYKIRFLHFFRVLFLFKFNIFFSQIEFNRLSIYFLSFQNNYGNNLFLISSHFARSRH